LLPLEVWKVDFRVEEAAAEGHPCLALAVVVEEEEEAWLMFF
jgi:hypothetical protein